MKQTDDLLSRRSILLGCVAGVASIAGCADFVTEPVEEESPTPEPNGEDERRIEDDEWDTGDTPLIRLGALADGWVGIGPEGLSDEENPPLRLREGVTYEIVWENRDGERHQLVIADVGGEETASTEPAEETGSTRSMEFTAHDDLEEYYCEFHTDSMRGEVRVGREDTADDS